MGKLLPVLVNCLFLCLSIGTQAQQNTFSKVLYDSLQSGIQAKSMVSSFDNGYMIAGTSSQNGVVLKLDSAGNVLWSKEFNNNNPNYSPDIVFNNILGTNDSCFLVAGSAYESGSRNAFCIKLNASGDTVWSKAISQPGYSLETLAVQQTNDSGYVMTGYAVSNSAPYYKVFVVKLDLSGNLQWLNILAGGNNSNIGNSIKQMPDSSYVITGYLEDFPPYEPNAFLLKLSSTGAFSWAKKYNTTSPGACSGIDLLITSNGFLCYFSMGSPALLKTDFSGNILWSKFYNQPVTDENISTQKLFQTADSALVFVSGNCWESAITKTDSVGNIIWSNDLILPAVNVIESGNKDLIIVGNGPRCSIKQLQTLLSPQIGIIKTDSLGIALECVSSNNIVSFNDTIISSFTPFTSLTGGIENAVFPGSNSIVLSNYSGCVDIGGDINENKFEPTILVFPNPSSGIFTVIASEVKSYQITIYDLMGRKIQQIDNHSEIDLTNHQKGVYFYKVIFSDNKMVTGKLIITE